MDGHTKIKTIKMTTKTKAMMNRIRKTSFDFALLISRLSKNWS